MSTIVATKSDLKHLKVKMNDLISIEGLSLYGFDEEIINGLLDYDIFPTVIEIDHVFMVKKSSIQALINRFMKNELKIYKTVDDKEKLVKEAQEYLEKHKHLITPEELEKVKAGEINLIELLESKEKEAESASE